MAKLKKSVDFSGGICFLMIWPGGTVQSSRGMRAPVLSYNQPSQYLILISTSLSSGLEHKHTSTQITLGNCNARLRTALKYAATVIGPLPASNVN